MPFFGVCYSPYHRRNDRSGITESGVDADMAIIASRFTHIRTYSAEDGDQWNVDKAAKRGLKIALGIWIDDNQSGDVNHRNIDHALQQAQAAAANYGGNPVIDLVVGNEINRGTTKDHHQRRIHFDLPSNFVDKLRMQGTSEGMFGTYTHSGRNLSTIQYGTDDFTHWDVQEPNPGQVTVDYLTASDLQPAVVSVYEGS